MSNREILEELCSNSEKSAQLLKEICKKVKVKDQKDSLLKIANSICQHKTKLEEIKENCDELKEEKKTS